MLFVLNVTVPVLLLQMTRFVGCITSPVGFTVMLKVFCGPVQLTPPFVKSGATVIVAVIGDVPVFTAVKDGRFPLPDPGSPIPGTELLQV